MSPRLVSAQGFTAQAIFPWRWVPGVLPVQLLLEMQKLDAAKPHFWGELQGIRSNCAGFPVLVDPGLFCRFVHKSHTAAAAPLSVAPHQPVAFSSPLSLYPPLWGVVLVPTADLGVYIWFCAAGRKF